MSRDFIHSKASVLLDLVRGLAALLVLSEHWRNIFFVDFSQISQHRVLLLLPYLMTATGHQAVVIFFVLSGYLISGSVFRSIERGTWSWGLYLMHRLLRLWIVLLPGLLLCALWDGIGLHLHLAPMLYGGAGNHMVPDVASVHTVKLFFQNLGFLQLIVGPTFGSDTALWSLSCEFWYYILFPLGLFAILPKVPLYVRIVCGALFLATVWFIGGVVLEGFPIWLLGMVLALMPTPRFSMRVRISATAIFAVLYFGFAKIAAIPGVTMYLTPTIQDYILGAATFLFLWVLLSATAPSAGTMGDKAVREVSKFSYTLYVCHTPLCVLLAALLAGNNRWYPDPAHILVATGVLGLLIAYSYGVAYLTEFRTDRVRRFLESRFFAKKRAPLVAAVPGSSR